MDGHEYMFRCMGDVIYTKLVVGTFVHSRNAGANSLSVFSSHVISLSLTLDLYDVFRTGAGTLYRNDICGKKWRWYLKEGNGRAKQEPTCISMNINADGIDTNPTRSFTSICNDIDLSLR